MTPTLIAAEKCNCVMVEFLIKEFSLTRQEIIDAKELLGASLLNGKLHYNKDLGFSYLLYSQKLRFVGK